ncbi:hypothetical protein KQH51_04795 [bacterium]|nr:hypothetical protein [bacterium]MCB2202234.1 hypothetical protein [bacterium]
MKRLIIFLVALAWVGAGVSATPVIDQPAVDTNTAFYEGETLNYVFSPPSYFKMVGREAINDGYSFAFIPDSDSYSSTDIVIGVNIYKIRELDVEDVIESDTANLREHYGEDVVMHEVDSIVAYNGQAARTFYINSPERFLPNVMISYVDGGSEMVIFELVISERALRFAAESKFVSAVRNLNVMPKRELGYGER